MKKRWILTVCLLLLACLTVSCGQTAGKEPVGTGDSDSDENSDVLWLVKDQLSDYRVVISESAPKYVRPQATALINRVNELTGVKLEMVTDGKETTGKEILLGDTNRPESTSALGERDIYVAVKQAYIVIKGGSEDVLDDAVNDFLSVIQQNGTDLSVSKTYLCRKTVEQITEGEKKVIANLKVGTYNLHYGSDIKQDYTLIANDILEHELDVVGFQEVYKNTTNSLGQDATFLIAQHTGYRYCFFAPAHLENGGGEYGNAIVSKYPIVAAGYETLPAESSKSEPRCIMWADINVNGVQVRFYNVHLSVYEQLGENELQMRWLGTFLPKDRAWIMSGDFNCKDTTWSCLRAALGDEVTMINSAETPLITGIGQDGVDNIVFSADVKYTSRESVYTKHSDHYLVFATVEIYG